MEDDLPERLKKRAAIRRQIQTRKSVQEGAPDRIADLLEEAAAQLTERVEQLEKIIAVQAKALNNLACWEDGEVVNGRFDCPGNASEAREALAEVEKLKAGSV
jgi:hypothetical protein